MLFYVETSMYVGAILLDVLRREKIMQYLNCFGWFSWADLDKN